MQYSTHTFSDIDRHHWDKLFLDSGSRNLFYAWDFVQGARVAWEAFAGIHVVVGRIHGAISMLQPIGVSTDNGRRSVWFFRTLTVDGIEPLGLDNLSRATLTEFIRYLDSEFSPDEIIVESASERFFALLRRSVPRRQLRLARIRKGTEIHLPGSVEQYWSSLRSDRRNQLKRKTRNAERAGLTFRVISADHGARGSCYLDALERLTSLHRKRFESLGKESFFITDEMQAFHRFVLRGNGEALSFDFIECLSGGTVIGSIYGAATRDDWMFLMSGFDPDFRRLSVGVVLMYRAIELAIKRGIRRFDLKVGAEQYKRWWSGDRYSVYDLYLYPKRGSLVALRDLLAGKLAVIRRLPADLEAAG